MTCAPALCGHKVEEGGDDVGVVVAGVARPEVEEEVDPGEVNIAHTWSVVTDHERTTSWVRYLQSSEDPAVVV